MFSALRSRLSCQNCWSISRSLKLFERQTIKINNRTFTFSALHFQQQKQTTNNNSSPPPPSSSSSSSSSSPSKLSSLMGEHESKTPFIFSKTSPEPKYSKTQTDDEKHEREAKAAWDVRMLKYTGYFLGIWLFSTIGYVILVWGAPQIDENGNIIQDRYSNLPTWQQYIKRSFREVINYWQTIKDPTSDKLLPEPLPAPYQPKYTLVIEMSGILLHPEWAYNTGWRYKKRPGLDYFIKEIGYPVYEVVIYTKEAPWGAASVIENMDTDHRIMYRLFRENTRFLNGTHVKDLSCLNRDLKKIIFLDWDEKAYQLQPRNALHRLKQWNGEDDDRQLLHLASFLRMIAVSGVDDVRDVLDHYNQESDPVEAFLIRQQKLLELEEQKKQQAAAAVNSSVKQSKGLFSGWTSSKRF
ncbi:unnamed protein product [Rotaria sordida]|uniref:Mitochondrial import inner membrane translocase subunit TIM50 n=1 Tax=Rotaria sordida TaxID=392033 RepID=A0A814F568_9BILA|nr:unnamed protein product [Rotaria sordida]CAF0978221.1 unnamed protein product [Rotaria sordida]CAF3526727.1 unnamed protein product [Rotaria sordida]CAF3573150.1 unnamed protein product [Rotaria sordida]